MTLETFFQIVVSVAAVWLCVMLLAITVVGIWLVRRIKRLLQKLETMSDTATAITGHLRTFVATTTDRLTTLERVFLTAQGVRQLVGYAAEAFYHFKSKKRKEH